MSARTLRTICLATVLLLASSAASAQGRGGPGGGGPGGGPGGPGGGPAGGGFGPAGGGPGAGPGGMGMNGSAAGRAPLPGNGQGGALGGLQLGPPGRWWDDKRFCRDLGLRPEQQKKMDVVFNANKGVILQRFEALQEEQSRMQELSRQKPLQEAAIFAQVDRVSQARAALEKATAHLSLLLRQEMDPDQIAKLQVMH